MPEDLSAIELLQAYDVQLRAHLPTALPNGVRVERDGPLLRYFGLDHRGFVEYRDLEGLTGTALDDLIARQISVFADRGEAFEWKFHEHDQPDDLRQRLEAFGLVAEDVETVLIAPTDRVADHRSEPPGVGLREVSERRDLDRIAALGEAIWRDDRTWLVDSLEREMQADPTGTTIVVAEADGEVVAAGWVRYPGNTEFATFWGGATAPGWRGRGIYRALVSYRARLARERCRRYLEVDASANSSPILKRLGFLAVTTTIPFVWTPEPLRTSGTAQR
jgi:GNAT superfamily N-acetyltransferase